MGSARKKLGTYRDKRDFRKTPEPSGRRGGPPLKRAGNPIFVIQQHDASSRHWDFRLEVSGVLKSWAVPKGPSTDPSRKRLAIATEDHPLAYADFEGVIPESEYGGGTVIVWDAGPYRNVTTDDEGDTIPIARALDRGHVRVWLEGKKVRGGYALVRRSGGGKRQWLLIKMRDEGADARRRPIRTQPHSVLSGRTIKAVAAAVHRERAEA